MNRRTFLLMVGGGGGMEWMEAAEEGAGAGRQVHGWMGC